MLLEPVAGDPKITVWAPASLSNLGPGFDALGVAVEGPGDRVTVRLRSDGKMVVRVANADGIPEDVQENTASVAAATLFRVVDFEGGADVIIEKGIPLGSGLGGSAASAAAGALAAALATGCNDVRTIVEAALAGEETASGSVHGDNVIPALLGGFILLNARDPRMYRRLNVPSAIHFAILVPETKIETAAAREALPPTVTLQEAVNHASSLGLLVHALCEGDTSEFGRMMMSDLLVEPVRARRMPFFGAVREAALSAGAVGCAISGSGPAMVAVCATRAEAEPICTAMSTACLTEGFSCSSFAASPDHTGARQIRPDVSEDSE